MAKKLFYVCAALLVVALAQLQLGGSAEGQAGNTLLAMTDYPASTSSAVAVDATGGIYFGHARNWTRVGTTPSAPASIWTRPSTGEVFIPPKNGDLYRLESDWSLTFDSNVFGGAPTPAQSRSWGQVKSTYRK